MASPMPIPRIVPAVQPTISRCSDAPRCFQRLPVSISSSSACSASDGAGRISLSISPDWDPSSQRPMTTTNTMGEMMPSGLVLNPPPRKRTGFSAGAFSTTVASDIGKLQIGRASFVAKQFP